MISVKSELESGSIISHEPILLGQSWSPGIPFKKTEVRIGWAPSHITLFAQMEDEDVASDATAHNQRMWELGDVFEVFIRTTGQAGYREIHITPNGFLMHLAFPADDTITRLRSGGEVLDPYFQPINRLSGRSRTTANGWEAILTIDRENKKGDEFQLSLCRYDAHPDGSETISSTSPHPVADFHRPDEWLWFRLD